MSDPTENLLSQLDNLNAAQLRRLLQEQLTKRKLGLYWESSILERDHALNADIVLPRLVPENSCNLESFTDRGTHNLIIEGDNFDSLRLLKTTHAGKIRVIYIDPPYNTGNKDWVYNDHYVGKNDRWRHSQWLEFLYRRLVLAKDLLTQDGVIMVSINDENRARLEMLMDEVFPGRRLGSLTWRTRQGSNADQQCFLSVDHEHILCYGNPGFKFNGFQKSYEMYSNPDNDPRGDWRIGDITLGFSYRERPNLYYPLVDPKTDIHYPCSPESVWRYATQTRLRDGQRLQSKTMEEFIDLGQIIFPENPRTETWETLESLLEAIDRGDVPKGGRSLLLRRELPNLEYWVGKKVGFGRPQFKRYKADLRNQNQPLSSWIVPTLEEGDYDAENSFVSGTNQEGGQQVAASFGHKAFNYAKPLSLMQGLLQQATRPGDTVLDFFAGSGTTAHAVLALNAEDNGNRKFILCSSTEATAKEPDKNLCRDVCAARMHKVIEKDYPDTAFAYIALDKLHAADIPFESSEAQGFQLLTLRLAKVARPWKSQENGLQIIMQSIIDGSVTVLCQKINRNVLGALATLPIPAQGHLRVFSKRPDTVRDYLHKAWEGTGRTIESLSLNKALLHSQRTPRRITPATALS